MHQDIGSSHRARTQVAIEPGSRLGGLLGEEPFVVSCHHHQSVAKLGQGLVVEAQAGDGTIEALDLPGATGFFAAVQWHPEDTYDEDPTQQALFRAFIESA